MSKVQMIVVDSGELYVFGKLISRHPEMPWLFSITDVYKACEKPIKGEAKKYGKDPKVTYKSKRPGAWMQGNVTESRIDSAANKLRKRITKYGIDCGFRKTYSDAMRIASLTNKDTCVKVVKGNFSGGLVQGTYVCQDFIVLYAGFLNDKLQSSVIDTFISVLNGYTQEITKKVQKNAVLAKGTQARTDNIQLNHRLVESCGLKRIIPMKVQEGINEGVLGMTATKYKKMHSIKEPFNDNLTEDQVDMKNTGISLATFEIRNHAKETLTHKEGKQIGKSSGLRAKLIFNNPEVHRLLDKLEKKLEAMA